MTYTIVLIHPPSANTAWRKMRNRMIKSPAYIRWQEYAIPIIRKMMEGSNPHSTYKVSIIHYEGKGLRSFDLDNYNKVTYDTLKEAGVIADDSCWNIPYENSTFIPFYGKKSKRPNAQMLVTISEREMPNSEYSEMMRGNLDALMQLQEEELKI